MTEMILAAAAWVALHVLVSGHFRPQLVARFGEASYRGLFSVLSLAFLAALIAAYRTAPYIEFWPTTPALKVVPLMVMPVALLFLVAGLRPTNPTLAGPDMKMKDQELPVVGFTKITRHPMLWGFTLWAVSHMIANGDAATLLLAGSVLVTSLNGMVSIDRKRAAKFGPRWTSFADQTSIVPFAAIAQGRQRAGIKDIGWLNILAAAALYALLLVGHTVLFGVSADIY